MRQDSFEFDVNSYKNSDLKSIDENIIKMIKWMMSENPENRPTCQDLFQCVPELKIRNDLQKSQNFRKSISSCLSMIEEECDKCNLSCYYKIIR